MFIYVHWRTTPYPGARTSPSGVKHGDSPYLHASSLPICTPPASIHIHSLFSVLSPKPSCAGLLWGLSQYHWCWSPVQLGLRWRVNLPPPPPPSRSPAPTASSQPSPGSAEGVCAPRPWAAARAAPDCNSQFTGRIWPQVIAPAASGSPRLALLPGNKSPKRSSYKVSIQLIMDLQEKAAPDPKYLLWSAPLRRHQWFFSRLC